MERAQGLHDNCDPNFGEARNGATTEDEQRQLDELDDALASGDLVRLAQLTRNASTARVCLIYCDALASVAATYDERADLGAVTHEIARAVVEALVSVIRAPPASDCLCMLSKAVQALHLWCAFVPPARGIAGEAGAGVAVVAAMHVGEGSAFLQSRCCAVLAVLFEHSPANLLLGREARAIEAVLHAMRTHSCCAELQTFACIALRTATKNRDDDGASVAEANRIAAVEQGALVCVAPCLIGSTAELSQCACAAVASLLFYSPELIALAQRLGVFEATLHTMRLHSAHVDLLSYGCCVLRRMGYESTAKAASTRLGAHATIVDVMERFSAHSGLQEHACAALTRLLPDVPTQDDETHAGVVSCIVNAMRTHTASPGVQRHACACLRRLVHFLPRKNKEACCLGAFVVLTEVLETHTARADIMDPCLAALRYICSGVNLRKSESAAGSEAPTVSDAGVTLRALVAAMRAHPENMNIQRHGIVAAGFLVGDLPQCAEAAVEAGVFEAAVAALRVFVSDESLSESACCTVGIIADRLRETAMPRLQACTRDAVAAVLPVLRTHADCAKAQENAAYALMHLYDGVNGVNGRQTELCSAVLPLCRALRAHRDAVSVQRRVLQTLSVALLSAPAACVFVLAGPTGIGAVTELLLHCSPQLDFYVFKHATSVILCVAAYAEANLSSADVVSPLVHVVATCSQTDANIALYACKVLRLLFEMSEQHVAEAGRRSAAAVVQEAARAHPEAKELQDEASRVVFFLETPRVAPVMARAVAVAHEAAAATASQARAREEAERRADAMAAALIAEEEEEAARAAAAPPASARKSRKKRGGGAGAAGGPGAEPASGDSLAHRNAAPSPAAASAAALSELSLDDGGTVDAAVPLSAAAARRRRRAAAKAARRRAGSAARASGGAEAAGSDGAPASDAEDETDADDMGAASEAADAAPPQKDPFDVASPAPAAAPPPPLPPAPPVAPVMKECCVCLADMPAAEQLVLVPCGHRCLCEECWRDKLLPRESAARLCPICGVAAATAVRVFDA